MKIGPGEALEKPLDISRRVTYLSGAPRLSTSPNTESLGPRSHMLGVIAAFRALDYKVDEFIVGDNVSSSIGGAGSEDRMSKSALRLLVADGARLYFRVRSRCAARRRFRDVQGEPSLVYERYALFQELGSVVRRSTATWILEVNALLAIEATSERRATSSRWLASKFEERSFKRADALVVVSDELKKQLASVYGISDKKIFVVPNGVDTTRFPLAERTGGSVSGVTIGFVGSLYRWQNLDLLLQSVSRLGKVDLIVRIAGGGQDDERLREIAKSLGISDRVEFVGRLHPDDVPKFLSGVDICYAGHGGVNGSYFSPLKLWEYLAAGRPVISSKHGDSDHLIESGYPLVTFDWTDSRTIDEALHFVNENLESLATSAIEMQPRVWSENSWASRLEPVLSEIAEELSNG